MYDTNNNNGEYKNEKKQKGQILNKHVITTMIENVIIYSKQLIEKSFSF